MTNRAKAGQKESAVVARSNNPIGSGGRIGNARLPSPGPKCDIAQDKKIVIVDDHPLFRKGLEQLVNSEGGFAVCGEATNAGEAMEVIRRLKPDLAIVDLSLPTANGIELIKNIRAEFP